MAPEIEPLPIEQHQSIRQRTAQDRSWVPMAVYTLVKPLPILEPNQNDVDASLIFPQEAVRIEKLLKDLIVRREFDRPGLLDFLHPELEHFLHRFSRKGSRNRNAMSRTIRRSSRVATGHSS